LLVLLVIGGIVFGLFTPSEAASIGATGALAICAWRRRLNWPLLYRSLEETLRLLRPSILDDFGLGPSLQRMAEGFSQRTGIRVNCESEIQDRVAAETETHVFRIAQEALTNIARHSGATEARLKLAVMDATLLLTISDNGSGMVDNGKGQGLGLLGMRARARSVGGSCSIESQAGKGLIVRVQAPMRPRVDDQENSHTAG
jgi:signal transduction histidine kinase